MEPRWRDILASVRRCLQGRIFPLHSYGRIARIVPDVIEVGSCIPVVQPETPWGNIVAFAEPGAAAGRHRRRPLRTFAHEQPMTLMQALGGATDMTAMTMVGSLAYMPDRRVADHTGLPS